MTTTTTAQMIASATALAIQTHHGHVDTHCLREVIERGLQPGDAIEVGAQRIEYLGESKVRRERVSGVRGEIRTPIDEVAYTPAQMEKFLVAVAVLRARRGAVVGGL